MSQRATLALLVVATLAVGLACEEPIEERVITPPVVMVVPVEARHVVDRIEASGQLVARAEATIAAQVQGEITGVSIEEGDAVVQGQVAIEIDPGRRILELESQRAQLAQAQADLEEAERELRRIERLRDKNAAAESHVDGARTAVSLARSRVTSAEAMMGLAERALRDSSVVVPFAGRIDRRHVSVGEFVSAGQRLFDLVDLDDLEVEFHLAELDSSRVKLGDPVGVRVAPHPDEVFAATVSVISPTIDRDTRTLRVKAVVSDAEGHLRPGLFARVDLGVSERFGVPVVPEEAVLQRSEGKVVYRLDEEGRVKRVKVRTGIHRGGEIELREGVGAGDLIVVRGQTQLTDGVRVRVRDADGGSISVPPGGTREGAAAMGGEAP